MWLAIMTGGQSATHLPASSFLRSATGHFSKECLISVIIGIGEKKWFFPSPPFVFIPCCQHKNTHSDKRRVTMEIDLDRNED
jgi:hypothetical protein